MKNFDKYPDNIVSLYFTESSLPELYEILAEFICTIPHIKTEIIFDNKIAKPIPCYVIPSNDYVSKIMHKLLYWSVPDKVMPIMDTTYYYTWFKNNKYYYTTLKIPNGAYIAISKEDYENYLLYAQD